MTEVLSGWQLLLLEGGGFVFLRVMDATRMLCRRQQTEQALHETFRGGVARYSWSATECRQIYQLMKI